MTGVRNRLILTARRLGIEQSLRDVHALRSREGRRDRRDMQRLRLLMALTLAEDACCVDVGANMGVVLRDMVRLAPRGQHIAYEPLPELAAQLKREFPQVDVRNAAVSDRTGEATFHRVIDRATRSSLSRLDFPPARLEPFDVRVEDLDSGLPDDRAPALIKIDVEGAEEQVLRGAARTLSRHHPTVVFEHNTSARHFGTSSKSLLEPLQSAGLRVFDIDGRGPYGPIELDRRIASGDMWTFVAHR